MHFIQVRSLAQEVAITKAATEQLSKSQVYRNEERTRYTGDQNVCSLIVDDTASVFFKHLTIHLLINIGIKTQYYFYC